MYVSATVPGFIVPAANAASRAVSVPIHCLPAEEASTLSAGLSFASVYFLAIISQKSLLKVYVSINVSVVLV